MKAVFDTSAFAKRYIVEAGSTRVDQRLQQIDKLGLSIICVPELISTANRRLRENSITAAQYQQIKQSLNQDIADATILDLTPTVMQHAIQLLEQNKLRAMDALHIGCALAWETDLFVSSDKRQIEAARKAGLTVESV